MGNQFLTETVGASTTADWILHRIEGRGDSVEALAAEMEVAEGAIEWWLAVARVPALCVRQRGQVTS